MKKKKSKKKIIIGAAAVLVVAGGVTVAGQRNSTENQIPQVQVVIAEKGDVKESVDATGNGFFCPGRCGEKGNKTDRV